MKLTKKRKKQARALKRILFDGFFIHLPYEGLVQRSNENTIRLWRAVVDQRLKDVIEYYMGPRFGQQRHLMDAKSFLFDNFSGTGQECELAHLNVSNVYKVFEYIERLSIDLASEGLRFRP